MQLDTEDQPAKAPHILIVEQTRLVGHLIGAALKDEPDMEVVGFATTVEEAMAQFKWCNLILSSTSLPDDRTLELIQCAREEDPPLNVVVMGLPDSEFAIPPAAYYIPP